MKISEHLAELGKTQAVQTEILKRIEAGFDEHHRHFHGDGNNDNPGILKRIDRLEVWDSAKNKVLWLLGGTILGAFVAWIKDLV